MNEINPQHEVTARKPHRCSWCDKEILPGEKYVTSTLKTDYIYEWREYDRCKPYVDEMFDDDVWGDYDPDYGIDAQTFYEFMLDKHPNVLLLLAINVAWLIICLFIKMIDYVLSLYLAKLPSKRIGYLYLDGGTVINVVYSIVMILTMIKQ